MLGKLFYFNGLLRNINSPLGLVIVKVLLTLVSV